ncbi:YmfQ family protein [Komagataeibacter melomenusus]
MVAPIFATSDFRTALLNLLPRGRIWSREPDGMPYQIAGVWAPTFQRSGQSAGGLIADAFPSTTANLLPEWEATLGLPDPCAGESPTVELRRAQVVARLTDNGGASVAYFIAFAATLGFDITITEFAPSRFGRKFGTPFGGDAWAHTWQVNAPQFTVTPLRFGNAFGEPFATWGSTVLQCELTARKPAHTILIFNYSEG